MITILLAFSAYASQPMWAGVPLVALPGVGLGTPSFSLSEPEWRARLGDHGLVRVALFDDEATASTAFAWWSKSAATTWPLTSPSGVIADEVAGDADLGLLVRDRNVVFFVSDPNGHADDVVAALRLTLTTDSSSAVAVKQSFGGVDYGWNGVGRRVQ